MNNKMNLELKFLFQSTWLVLEGYTWTPPPPKKKKKKSKQKKKHYHFFEIHFLVVFWNF